MLKIKDKVKYTGLNKIGKVVKIELIDGHNVCLVKYGLFKKMWCWESSLEKVEE